MSAMDTELPPFPPTIDLQSAAWDMYGAEANHAITERNNQIIAGLAVQRIEFSDHVYDFSRVLRLYGENIT